MAPIVPDAIHPYQPVINGNGHRISPLSIEKPPSQSPMLTEAETHDKFAHNCVSREWAHPDSNQGPTGYEPAALPLSYGPSEPPIGLEPITWRLRSVCSAIELGWRHIVAEYKRRPTVRAKYQPLEEAITTAVAGSSATTRCRSPRPTITISPRAARSVAPIPSTLSSPY